MCTVSYLPLEDSRYLLSSNRDESPGRNALETVQIDQQGINLLFPRDPDAGGTWFCCSDIGVSLCLLNGAYRRTIPKKSFRQSRGLIPLQYFEYRDPEKFAWEYNFRDIADFTLVICMVNGLYQLIWDGEKPDLKTLDREEPHFWSSATLYPEDVRKQRLRLFKNWLGHHVEYDQESIIDFHRYGGTGDPFNDFVMNRYDIVKTLSISSVNYKKGELLFKHLDLENNREENIALPPKSMKNLEL